MSIIVRRIKRNRYVYVQITDADHSSDSWTTRYVGRDSPESRLQALKIRLSHLKDRLAFYEGLVRMCRAEIEKLQESYGNHQKSG